MVEILTVFGTRPEAIKLAPVVKMAREHSRGVRSVVCVTSQHREMLDQVLEAFDVVPDYVLGKRTGDVGVIPHPATDHTNTTVPNKLFDYMAYRKPVLASDTRPVQRIIQSEGCGLVFRYDSPQEFRDQLGRLADPALRRSMGDRGRKAVEREYNWEVESARLAKFLAKELTRSDELSGSSSSR